MDHDKVTLPETNIALENQWLEDEFSFWDGLFSGASLRECGVQSLSGRLFNK